MQILYSCYDVMHCRSPLSQDADIKVINLVYKMLSAKQLKFAQLLRDALIAKVCMYELYYTAAVCEQH